MLPDLPGWGSLPAVTRFHNWAEMAGIVILAFLVIAEVVSYKYGQRKDDLTEQQQEATNQRHDEEMARLHVEAADANERAAKLENEAAQARVEQERLKAQLAGRTISPDISAQLERLLSQHSGKINVQWSANDTEAQYLAIQIGNVFGKANWEVRTLAISLTGAIAFGVRIPDSPSPATEIVRNIFRSVGIRFSTEMPPIQNKTQAFGGTIPDAPIVFIGAKPIPR
jgi:hypothetical protein